MHCDEGKKLLDSVQIAKNEAEKFRLPTATNPLGIETPLGRSISSEWMRKRREAEEGLEKATGSYQNHVASCVACHK
jgi:hypothetical protein